LEADNASGSAGEIGEAEGEGVGADAGDGDVGEGGEKKSGGVEWEGGAGQAEERGETVGSNGRGGEGYERGGVWSFRMPEVGAKKRFGRRL
jgi:hypothetical protein